jgi:MptA/FolE2 family GTP cyclohydrolase
VSLAHQLVPLGIEDVQSRADDRGFAIDEVGIDDLAYPVTIRGRTGELQQTVARAGMMVHLASDLRGTHMSRFVEVLHTYADRIGPDSFREMAAETRERLNSELARVELRFPYFLERRAPVSGMASMMQYECRLLGTAGEQTSSTAVGVRVPVTSLCPCSKEISDYGAHNQRGYVDVDVTSPWSEGDASGIWFEDLIEIVEEASSAPIFPLLKRSDERELTMRAYDNPAFVEDLVRDIAVRLRDDVRVASFEVGATNQESIHNHSAVARLRWQRSDG